MAKLIVVLIFFICTTTCFAQIKTIEYNCGAMRSIVYELSENPHYQRVAEYMFDVLSNSEDDAMFACEKVFFDNLIASWRLWQAQKIILNQFIRLNYE